MNLNEQIKAAAADPDALRQGIAGADIIPLLMSYVQLTGNTEYLDKVRPHIQGPWNYQQFIPDELKDQIRASLVATIEAMAKGDQVAHEKPSAERMKLLMETAVGQPVPDFYEPVIYEEGNFDGVDTRAVPWRKQPDAKTLEQFKVVVVGCGFSGIAMAARLSQAGIPHVIIEKNEDVGGTWHENTYPGIGVDTPCHFYSYSFEPNPEWTEYFAKGDEIYAYIQRCVEKFGIRKNVRFQHKVHSAEYNEASCTWAVDVENLKDGSRETLRANVLISAVGALNVPSIPDIPGLKDFKGDAFHTARWDHSVSLKGKRVAMLGTGASGIQIGPKVAPEIEQFTIFQRSPQWVIHHPLYHAKVTDEIRWATRHVPFYLNWFRFLLFWGASEMFHATLKMDPNWTDPKRSLNAENAKLREQLIEYITAEVGDRTDLLPKVIPDYPPFGKRMLRDTHWFKMLRRDNVELVAANVERVEEDGVVSEGKKYPADVIILATGFEASRMVATMNVRGRSGTSLRDVWGDDDPRAHLGITMPGFPNFFMIYGPNTNLAHGGSAVFHSECQIRYIMLGLREMIENHWAEVEVKREPFDEYNAKVDAELSQMVWAHPGVSSWYKNKKGRVIMNSPWRLGVYRNLTAEFNTDEFSVKPASQVQSEALEA